MKHEVPSGRTNYTVLMLVRDTAGAPKTGLTFESAGIDVCYTVVELDNDVILTAGAPVDLATPTLTDPHLDWGFLEVDATNAPGLYRLDIPDGPFAVGVVSSVVSFICTGCDPVHLEFVMSAHDTTVQAMIMAVDGKLSPTSLDGGPATLGGMLLRMADTSGGANFAKATDSLEAIRNTMVAASPGTHVIDGTVTVAQVLKALLAFIGGIAAGGGTEEVKFKNQANNKDVITLTGLDRYGNRTSTTLDFT